MLYRVYSGIENIDSSQWDGFLSSHSKNTVFQSSDFFHLLEKNANYEPIIIYVKNNNEKIVGILLALKINEYLDYRKRISSRVVIYGGPIIDPQEKGDALIVDVVLKELIRKVKKVSLFIEFRNFHDIPGYKDIFLRNGFTYQERLNQIITITNQKNIEDNFSKSKLRQIKKSISAGAEIIQATNEEEIVELYKILEDLYRKKVRKPLPSLTFFKEFLRASINNKVGIILLAKYKEKIIGGIVCPITQDRVMYEWYICGLDKKYREIHPSVLITWGALSYAVTHEIHLFDFMGLGIPNKDYGVRQFKIQFGGETVNFGRFFRVNNKPLFQIIKLGYYFYALMRKIQYNTGK